MFWALSAILMFAGGAIYVLWRPETLVMFSWFAALGLSEPVAHIRALATPAAASVPQWVYYSLPQALWLLSGCVAIHAVWRNWSSVNAQVWVFAAFAIAAGGEIGQALHVVPGAYDSRDLALILAVFITFEVVGFTSHVRHLQRDTRRTS